MLINIKINTIALPLLFFSLICHNSTAQSRMYRPLRISQPVKLDGKFDEPFWQQTEVMNDFVMADPQPGATPTEKTEFKIAYDDVNLYIAYSSFDSEANKIVHNNMERDSDPADDDGKRGSAAGTRSPLGGCGAWSMGDGPHGGGEHAVAAAGGDTVSRLGEVCGAGAVYLLRLRWRADMDF